MEWRERENQADGEADGVGMDVEAPGYSVLRQNPWETFVRQAAGRPLVLVGALVIVVLALLGVWRLVSGSADPGPHSLLELKSEMARIEQRIAAIEARPMPVMDLEGIQAKLDRMLQRLDRSEAALSQRIGVIEAQLKERGAPVAPVSAPAEPKAAAPAADAPARAETRSHTVQAGDTLFSISRSAGMSVDALRQLNNLKPDATIHPGDRLKLSP